MINFFLLRDRYRPEKSHRNIEKPKTNIIRLFTPTITIPNRNNVLTVFKIYGSPMITYIHTNQQDKHTDRQNIGTVHKLIFPTRD